ncbi:MAG: nodulation protein NfeD [Chloroflexi bacterium]|nr:nodulation protein NfeD [Chloroflexota bacterium]
MKLIRITLLTLLLAVGFSSLAGAQGETSLAIILTADGPIMPPMLEYIQRGIETAEQRDAELLVIELNTPGGSIDTMSEIIQTIRSSKVPVVVYVSPKDAQAASAGALITMAGHASAMAPRTVIGAASPVDSSGGDIEVTMQKKIKEDLKAKARSLVEHRGGEAVKLAEAMIDDAKAVTAGEALDAKLIDFISDDTEDLLQSLDGFKVKMEDGERTLNTEDILAESLGLSLIEQLLLFLTDPNIVFTLLSIGIISILIEVSSPGGWVAGFIGVVCVMVSLYGIGLLSVNWFGMLFMLTAFVLFILDIKAPTHGALTAAGVASFIVGALVLFNSPGSLPYQQVSPLLVVIMGIFLGLMFFGALLIALRAQHRPIQTGSESLLGKTGSAKTAVGHEGQVQVGSELWSAEKSAESESIHKGDQVEVVEVRGLRVIVKKK